MKICWSQDEITKILYSFYVRYNNRTKYIKQIKWMEYWKRFWNIPEVKRELSFFFFKRKQVAENSCMHWCPTHKLVEKIWFCCNKKKIVYHTWSANAQQKKSSETCWILNRLSIVCFMHVQWTGYIFRLVDLLLSSIQITGINEQHLLNKQKCVNISIAK